MEGGLVPPFFVYEKLQESQKKSNFATTFVYYLIE